MVGARGFEPPTPCPPDKCANRAALRSDGSAYSGGPQQMQCASLQSCSLSWNDLCGKAPRLVLRCDKYEWRPPNGGCRSCSPLQSSLRGAGIGIHETQASDVADRAARTDSPRSRQQERRLSGSGGRAPQASAGLLQRQRPTPQGDLRRRRAVAVLRIGLPPVLLPAKRPFSNQSSAVAFDAVAVDAPSPCENECRRGRVEAGLVPLRGLRFAGGFDPPGSHRCQHRFMRQLRSQGRLLGRVSPSHRSGSAGGAGAQDEPRHRGGPDRMRFSRGLSCWPGGLRPCRRPRGHRRHP